MLGGWRCQNLAAHNRRTTQRKETKDDPISQIYWKYTDSAGIDCSNEQDACVGGNPAEDHCGPIPTLHSIHLKLQRPLAHSPRPGLPLAAYPSPTTNIAVPNANSVEATNTTGANTNSIAACASSKKPGRYSGILGQFVPGTQRG